VDERSARDAHQVSGEVEADRWLRSRRPDDQHWHAVDPAAHEPNEIDGVQVRPVKVVEEQHERG
jgi:hypothetical protein